MKKAVALAVAMITIVAACGGGSDAGGTTGGLSADEQAAAAEFAIGFKEGFDDEAAGFVVSDEEAKCVSEKYVGAFGVARLEEIGDFNDDVDFAVPVDEAKQMASLFLDCVPMKDMIIDSMASAGDVTASQSECLSDTITDDDIQGLLVQTFAGENAVPDTSFDLFAAMLTCLSP